MKKVSYKKLWHLMLDKEINKRNLAEIAEISTASVTRLAKNECVNLETLVRICTALDCELHDIVELLNDIENKE